MLIRTTRLLAVLLLLVADISCTKHARHPNHLKEEHSVKKFNIMTQGGQQDSMMVMMKGMDGTAGRRGPTGDPGSPGNRGAPGPPGLKGTQGVCTKEQCESDELKALIQRVLELEKYVKDKQNQTKPASSQGANAPTPQPSKAAAASQAPSSGQSQPASATAVPSGSTQKPYTSSPQPPKPAALPASSPVPASAQGQPAPFTSVPAGSPQVIWSNPAPPPVSPSPFGVTIQSTLEAPGTVLGGTGQVDIQGVVTPQVSVVQGYPGSAGNTPGFQRGFKKSRIFSNEAVTRQKHVPKKAAYRSAVHHKTRTPMHTS